MKKTILIILLISVLGSGIGLWIHHYIVERKDAVNYASDKPTTIQIQDSVETFLGLGMSEKSLYNQLTSSDGLGYDSEKVKITLSNMDINWNEQAVIAAKMYMKEQQCSEEDLIKELEERELFTHEQAVYGATKIRQD